MLLRSWGRILGNALPNFFGRSARRKRIIQMPQWIAAQSLSLRHEGTMNAKSAFRLFPPAYKASGLNGYERALMGWPLTEAQ